MLQPTPLRIIALSGRPLTAIGGAERSLARLCRSLAAACHVTLLAPAPDLPFRWIPTRDTINIRSYRPDLAEQDICHILQTYQARGEGFDILYLGDKTCIRHPTLLLAFKQAFPNLRVVLKETTAGKLARVLGKLPAGEAAACLHNLDAIVCPSTRIKAAVNSLVEQNNTIHLACIPNGVDTHVFAPPAPAAKARLRRAFELPDDRTPLFLFVGRFAEKKNLDIIYGAWLDREQRTSEPGLLVLLGQAHKHYDAGLLRLIREDLTHVRIVDPVTLDEELVAWYQACDFFLAPTSREGLSNAFLEAAACGLYPIVTDASGYEDIVTSPEVGMLVEERNTSDVIRCLDMIGSDPEHYRRLGRMYTRQRIEAGYDIRAVAARMLALVHHLHSGAHSR
jgi:glycosyltransferase involved in cell wall biosynthesis